METTTTITQAVPHTGELTLRERLIADLEKKGLAETAITELRNKYLPLTINGVEDKEGYEAVYKARQVVKKTRTGIVAYCKQDRDKANAYIKENLAFEKELVAKVVTIEQHLESEELRIDQEKERIEAEKHNERKRAIEAIGFKIVSDVRGMGTQFLYGQVGFSLEDRSYGKNEFAEVLEDARAKFVAENARIEAERAAKIAHEQEMERQRKEVEEFQRQKAEMEAKRKEMEATIREQEEKLRRIEEQEKKEALQKLHKDILEARKAQYLQVGFHDAGYCIVLGRLQLTDADIMSRDDAAFEKHIEFLKEQVQKQKEKKEAEAMQATAPKAIVEDPITKAEPKELDFAPADTKTEYINADKERIGFLIDTLSAIQFPELTDPKARKIVFEAKSRINDLKNYLTINSNDL